MQCVVQFFAWDLRVGSWKPLMQLCNNCIFAFRVVLTLEFMELKLLDQSRRSGPCSAANFTSEHPLFIPFKSAAGWRMQVLLGT